MAEARSTGKITYVTLSLEDVRGSKRSDNESEDTESKKETVYSMYTQSFMDDYLIEFSEVFRRKVTAYEARIITSIMFNVLFEVSCSYEKIYF